MDPEPLFGVFANHALNSIGYQLSIRLNIGAQITGPSNCNGSFDVDGQLPGGFPNTKNRQYRTFAAYAQKSSGWCCRDSVAEEININTFSALALINQQGNNTGNGIDLH